MGEDRSTIPTLVVLRAAEAAVAAAVGTGRTVRQVLAVAPHIPQVAAGVVVRTPVAVVAACDTHCKTEAQVAWEVRRVQQWAIRNIPLEALANDHSHRRLVEVVALDLEAGEAVVVHTSRRCSWKYRQMAEDGAGMKMTMECADVAAADLRTRLAYTVAAAVEPTAAAQDDRSAIDSAGAPALGCASDKGRAVESRPGAAELAEGRSCVNREVAVVVVAADTALVLPCMLKMKARSMMKMRMVEVVIVAAGAAEKEGG